MANFDLKDYVPVHERITKFYKEYPNGRINTDIHSLDAENVIFKASVYRNNDDAEASATGFAMETKGDGHVNIKNFIENAESSAVGRALAFLGYEIKRGIASREEMQKAERQPDTRAGESKPQAVNGVDVKKRIANAILSISNLKGKAYVRATGVSDETYLEQLKDQYRALVAQKEDKTQDKHNNMKVAEKLSKAKAEAFVEPVENTGEMATEAQIAKLSKLAKRLDYSEIDIAQKYTQEASEVYDFMTEAQVNKAIAELETEIKETV